MDIKELQSFKLGDAVKFHNELNPKLFMGNRLDPAVKKQLIEIAKDFLQELGVEDIKVKDITLSGSNAAYSYTPHSDLDLHVLIDYNQFPNNPVYKELFMAKKNLYNDKHDITIRGIPVELYAQDSNEPFVSLGQYSILNDKWIQIPTKRRANFDQNATKAKFGKLQDFVLRALKEKNVSKVRQALDIIKRYRKAGLTKGGEFSPENLAYKALRNQGAIQKLFDLRDKLHSKHLSIENMYANINEATDKPIIYFDMDGVLADFNGGYEKLFGKQPGDSARDDPNVGQLVGSDFFSKLDKLPHADELIRTAVKLFGGYSICSSPLRNDHKNSELNKRLWIQQHLDPQPDNIVITGKKDSYAKGKNVLIDDKPKNIIPWRDRGGIGILYSAYTDDPNSVIEQLKQIAGVVDEDIPVTQGPTQKQRTAALSKTQPKLGSGYFGKVYDQPEGELGIGTAKKISRFDQDKPTLDGYYAYINKLMSLKDQNDNPYLPQVYNANVVKPKRGAPYFELDMEKLTPWQDLEEDELLTIFSKALDVEISSVEQFRQLVGRKSIPYKDIIITELLRFMTNTLSDPNYKDIKGNSIKDPQLIEAINIIRYLQKTGYGEDLHAGNIMVRRTKYGPQLVLTDPLSFGNQAKIDQVGAGNIRVNTIGVTLPPDYFVYAYDKFSNAVKIDKMYGSSDEVKKEVRQKYDPYWYDVEIIANDKKLDSPARPPKPTWRRWVSKTPSDMIPNTSTTQQQARNKQHGPKKYVVYDQPHNAPPWKTKKMIGDVVASSENEALQLARQKFPNVPPHKISVLIDILGSDFDKKLDEEDDYSIEAREIDKKLRAAGYKKLGAGAEAAVYIRDQGSVIKILMPDLEDMKDLNKDFYNAEKTFIKFYNFVKQNKGNPFLPKFIPIQGKDYARFKIGDRTFLQISMEQLYPYKKNSLEEAIIWAFSEFAASKTPWSEVEDHMGDPETYELFGDDLEQNYLYKPKNTKPNRFSKAWQTIAMTDKNKLSYYHLLYETMAALYQYGRKNNMAWDLHTENVMRRKDGTLVITDPFYGFINNKLNEVKAMEDYDPNGPPPGPEFKPTMPAGTVRVDVSDVYDWYKLGQHISNMKGLGKHDFGQGPPSTIMAFGSEPEEHRYIQDLEKTGLTTTDIDPIDKNQPKGMKRQKTDPTFNVGVAEGLSWSSLDEGLSMEDKMAIFEEYAINGNLTEAIDDDKKDYFISLFTLSDMPIKNKNYIVAPLALVGNKIMPLDNPSFMKYLGQGKDGLVFNRDDVTKTYPSKAIRDLSVFNVFTFANKAVYDKFRTALSLKFDINLPSVGSIEQGLTESLDKPYKLKWYPGDMDEVEARAELSDGDDLTIMFNLDANEEGEEAWSVEFYRNNSQKVTGEGDAQRIFATVLSAIQTFIKKYKPDRVIFSASKEVEPGQKPQSRANLYDRLVQRYARALGYKAFRADAGNKVHYELSRIKQSVAEGFDNIPSTLYHATYRPLLMSIKKYGLGGDRAQAKWEDSKPGVVYLALDKNVAESYAETSDVVPDEWLDEIVILKISTNGLDTTKFHLDRNVQDNQGDTVEYHGVIPVNNIKMIKQGVAEVVQPSQQLQSYTLYHGTPTKAGYQGIASQGLKYDPKLIAQLYKGKENFAPIPGGVYMSKDFGNSVRYSFMSNVPDDEWAEYIKQEPIGYVFEFSGKDLTGVTIDEDELGSLLLKLLNSKKLAPNLLKIVQSVPEQLKLQLRQPDLTGFEKYALAGKWLVNNISDATMQYLIKRYRNVVNYSSIKPNAVWIIPKPTERFLRDRHGTNSTFNGYANYAKRFGKRYDLTNKQSVAEGGAETSWSDGDEKITLQDILELTKHIKQINLPINDNLKSKLIHWDGNPKEIERINQVMVSNQFPILVMLDGQGQIDWILDGNHRLHKAIKSQAKTIPAKLIKPSDLSDKARKVFHITEQSVAEGREQDYLSQIPNLIWKPINRRVWNTIQDEGLDEEQDAHRHTDWVMASLPISVKDAQALRAFEDDAIEDFNRFDIQLKSRYPGLTDLIDYDRGTVTIVKPSNMQGVAEGAMKDLDIDIQDEQWEAIVGYVINGLKKNMDVNRIELNLYKWGGTELVDVDQKLEDRGFRDVADLAKHIKDNNYKYVPPTNFGLGDLGKGLREASGYIPSKKEKNDPRFKTALTIDVKPDSIKKNAKAFGFKVSRAGIPPLLRP